MIIGTVLDDEFFSSSTSSAGIVKGSKVKTVLPKMLPGEDAVEVLATTEEATSNTTQGLMTSQIIVTLILSVSLKQMWNLFCVMQVLGYIQNFAPWPAVGNSIID